MNRVLAVYGLDVFSCPKDGTAFDTAFAVGQLVAAKEKLDLAYRVQPRELMETGFVAIRLRGVGKPIVVAFDHGNQLRVGEDGRSVIRTPVDATLNIAGALSLVERLGHYVTWLGQVEQAMAADIRPPAIDRTLVGKLNERVLGWVGPLVGKAEAYHTLWRARTEQRARERAGQTATAA